MNRLARHETLDTVFNEPLEIRFDNGQVGVQNALVNETGIVAGNGPVHVVDRVILMDPEA